MIKSKALILASISSLLFGTSCLQNTRVTDTELSGKASSSKESFHKKLQKDASRIDQAMNRMTKENQLVLNKIWELDHAQISMAVISNKLAWWAPTVNAKKNKSAKAAKTIGFTIWSIPSVFGGYGLASYASYASSIAPSLAASAEVFLAGWIAAGAYTAIPVAGGVVIGYQISSIANISLLRGDYESVLQRYEETEKELNQILDALTQSQRSTLKEELKSFMKEAKIRSVDVPSSLRSYGFLKRLNVI